MRRLLLLSLLLLSPVALGVVYFLHYERIAYDLMRRQHYHYEDANSIKHAYAAAQMYALLRPLAGDRMAERAVLNLGIFNERFEQMVRYPKDSPSESAKDLCNNYMGVIAARWHATGAAGQATQYQLILRLADKKLLNLREATVPMPPSDIKGQAIVDAALVEFKIRQPRILNRLEAALHDGTI